jgi:hypothetical protein
MKRPERLIVPALGVAAIGYAIRCWYRGRHAAIRHPLSGYRCKECGKAAADLEAMGEDATLHGSRAFSREHGGSFYRGASWTPHLDERARRGGL